MCSRWTIAALLAIVPLTSSSAQQSHLDTRQQIEQLARTFNERYNKRDAAAIASMFTKDAVRVSPGVGAVSIGPQAIEESFKTQFSLGFNRIDRVIDQVSSLGADAAITIGIYQVSGQGQNGPVKLDGYWTEIDVREGGVWKIRLVTVVPKTAPNTVPVAAQVPPAQAPAAAQVPAPQAAAAQVPITAQVPAAQVAVAAQIPPAQVAAAAQVPAGVQTSSGTGGTEPQVVRVAVSNSAVASPEANNSPQAKDIAEIKKGYEAKSSSEAKKSIVLVNIDKEQQKMTVSIDGVQTYDWPVSTGRAGYSTPSGNYTATSMNEIWYSKQWDNAPMPHAIFFMKDGHAIHGTLDVKNLGKPASHGCVRISPANATTLFALVKANGLENTQVVLSGVTPGGEYKVAGPASAVRYGQPGAILYETGDGYYSQQPQARAYYAQPQANAYYSQPQARGYYTQSQLRAYYAQQQARGYYAQPQASPAAVGRPVAAPYYAAPQGYYVVPYAPQ